VFMIIRCMKRYDNTEGGLRYTVIADDNGVKRKESVIVKENETDEEAYNRCLVKLGVD